MSSNCITGGNGRNWRELQKFRGNGKAFVVGNHRERDGT